MKKLSVLLLAALLGSFLLGCSGEEKEPDAPTTPAKLKVDKNKPASNENPGAGTSAVPQ